MSNIGVILIGVDGAIQVRTGQYLGDINFGGTAIGGPQSPIEARLLADIAEAAVTAVELWRSGESLSRRDDTEEGSHLRAVELGRRGGKKGGLARARALSPERRSEIARHAAQTRWEATHASGLPYPKAEGSA